MSYTPMYSCIVLDWENIDKLTANFPIKIFCYIIMLILKILVSSTHLLVTVAISPGKVSKVARVRLEVQFA